MLSELMNGRETWLYEDAAYRGEKPRAAMREASPTAKDSANELAYRNWPLSKQQKQTNAGKSAVRSKVEYVFLVTKKLWGFTMVSYRGLAKNKNRLLTTLALVNLYIVREQLG